MFSMTLAEKQGTEVLPSKRSGLLPVFVQNPTGLTSMGFPSGYKPGVPPPTPRVAPDESSGYFLAPGLLLRGLPSRLPTIEQVDELYYKNENMCVLMLGFAVLSEVVLLIAMVTPYYNDGVPSMISAFWKETPTRWLGLVIAEIGYQVILIFFALVAYLPTVGSPRKWAKLYYVAIAGMLLEVVSVAVVRRINLVSFLMRGIIALYATSLAGLSNCARDMRLLGRVALQP